LSLNIVVLAAGQGKRMMSDLPKVVHETAGRTLIDRVLGSVAPLEPDSTVVVLGHGAERVAHLLPDWATVTVQERQLGTGDATRVGLEALGGDFQTGDRVMVLYGDMPLLTTGLLERLADLPQGVAARMVTAVFERPDGYGRVIRDDSGAVTGIVEDRDCSPEQAAVQEINAGVYCFDAVALAAAISRIGPHNAQGEFYLTDAIGILVGEGRRVEPVPSPPEEVVGINSQDQLAEATRLVQRRTARRLMDAGVWILDPDRTYIDDTVEVAPGARIYPGVHLEGATKVAAGAQVGPEVFASDSTIGDGSTVWYAVLRGATIGTGCEIGPYASLRPGSVVADGAKIGTFVETKNTTVGEGAKVPHLAYMGDATIGARANVGAGSITVNYDGVDKHPTEIGEEAFIGSDTMLVAPVKVGDRATTGAGSVITEDVSEGALALERSEQKEIPGYSERREARRDAKRKAQD
jgi:bifunctional UDP-N-acetylglucosamine pyrophosphorylase/glucosamine-1-phosphate N-acetyltransferase